MNYPFCFCIIIAFSHLRLNGNYTHLVRAPTGSTQLKTGHFSGVFPELSHLRHGIAVDVEAALLLFVCATRTGFGKLGSWLEVGWKF